MVSEQFRTWLKEHNFPKDNPSTEELVKAFPKPPHLSRRNDDWYVRYHFAKGQSMFNIKANLDDALADLWIQLRKIGVI